MPLNKDWVVCEVTDPGKGLSLQKELATQNVQGERGLSNVNQLASSFRQINPSTIEVIIDQNPTSINLNRVEDIWILSMNGNFDNISRGYHQKIQQIAKSLPPSVELILDLTNTTYLCSTALRDLLNLQKSVWEHHGKMITVIQPESRVMDIIESVPLDLYSRVDTRSEALAALQTSKKRKRPS